MKLIISLGAIESGYNKRRGEFQDLIGLRNPGSYAPQLAVPLLKRVLGGGVTFPCRKMTVPYDQPRLRADTELRATTRIDSASGPPPGLAGRISSRLCGHGAKG